MKPLNRLTAAEVADRLAQKTGLPLEHIKATLLAQAQLAYTEAANGFPIPGIGTFILRQTPERRGRYPTGPRSGEEIVIPAKQIIKFRVSRLAKFMASDPSQPVPDIFAAPVIPEFTFSSEASEIQQDSPLLEGIEPPFLSTRDAEAVHMIFYRLPDLDLPTGRICAADPMLLSGALPLSQSVAQGRYPVIITSARLGKDERVALAIIRFSQARTQRWQRLDDYGVDSGMGCFCDEAVAQLSAAAEEADMCLFEQATTEMNSSKPAPNWLHAHSSAGSIAIFSSGYGDGVYTSYLGMDEHDNPTFLVTDFRVIRWPPAT